MGDPLIVIVCALEFERRCIARTLGGRAEIVQAGPGARAVAACVDDLAARGATRIILAGVAGGLRPTSVCPPIARIVDREGNAWTPSLGRGSGGHGATLLGMDEPVIDPRDKAALGVAHEADLVDCESHAFAARATHHALDWTIVRGVSDGPGERLDPRVLAWTDQRGGTRLGAVAIDMLRHPGLIGVASRLGRRSASAMDAVCARLDEILAAPERVGDG